MLLANSSFIRAVAHTQLRNVRYHSIKVAVVGSGPAGFYTTQKLIRNPDIDVDIYEKLPVPFGLVRYGVAPDHAEVKNVVNSFTTIAGNDRVNFYGNVSLGKDISIEDLMQNYHAVVLSYGSSQDKLLGIEGEQSKNAISARNFVGWYNGLPEDRDLEINLDCDTACIIGQGNVAIDCARVLLKPQNLGKTDITNYAHERLAKSKIKKIYVIGRRGPMQTSFSSKELRELINLDTSLTMIEPRKIFEKMGVSLESLIKTKRSRRRLTELLLNAATIPDTYLNVNSKPDKIKCILKFLSQPTKILADKATNQVSQLQLQSVSYSSLDLFMNEEAKPDVLGEMETIDCGLIIRSIGYKSVMIDTKLPRDHKHGSILNVCGRVQGFKGLYCSGWLATGAIGVIAGTMTSSHVTAQSILDDIKSKNLPSLSVNKLGHEQIKPSLRSKGVHVVHFNDWLRIDELEKRIGEEMGKPREKFVDVNKMLDVVLDDKQDKENIK